MWKILLCVLLWFSFSACARENEPKVEPKAKIEFCGKKISVDATETFCDAGNPDLRALVELKGLRFLSINNIKASDVSALSSLTQLELLFMFGTKVSDVSALSSLTQLDRAIR